MKQQLFTAIRLTLVCILVFSIGYPLLILGVAQLTPGRGQGQTLSDNGRTVGYALEGQSFTRDQYFWGRPSAAGYQADASAASNKGPSNPSYLQDVQNRIDTFLLHNPGVKTSQIPADLVTASASGLDPDISVEAADVQVDRIAKKRGLPVKQVADLVKRETEQPLFGLLGTTRVNVLKLNLALDALK